MIAEKAIAIIGAGDGASGPLRRDWCCLMVAQYFYAQKRNDSRLSLAS